MSADLSVIMPLYNCAPRVEQAVRSVLESADGLLELVVVDDGSTDEGPAIVESIDGPIKLIRQQHAGVSAARNAAIAASSGAFIGFLDADDIWVASSPDPRRRELEAGAEIAFGKVRIVAGEPLREFSPPLHAVNLGGLIVRREAFERVGWFDTAMTHGEDGDWYLRAREAGLKSAHVDDVSLDYRLRAGSLMRDKQETHRGLTTALRQSLERRGKLGGGR